MSKKIFEISEDISSPGYFMLNFLQDLIAKNFLLAQMGFETEKRGVPEKYKKEVNDLIWKFLWDNKTNQIEETYVA